VKYWQIIPDRLSKPGWSYGYLSTFDSEGRTIWIADAVLGHETLRSLHQDNGCDSRKVCSARRANFGVFGHLIPAVANERSFRHASANDEKWNANDCTDYSPAK
jgi:hypothetical protein